MRITTDIVELELELEYCEGIVVKLRDEVPWGYMNENINDNNYPVKGKGVVKVKFGFVPGDQLKQYNGWVYRSDVDAYFHEHGMRFPNAAEALLPPAKEKQLGRGKHRHYVAFIDESDDAFVVSRFGRRGRGLGRDVACGGWVQGCIFVGVYE